MQSHVFRFAQLSVIAIVASAPAHAAGTLTRTFVSSAGIDSNPCTITQPCATFARAFTQVQANGIIAALDPGKYGPLTITYPVTVNGNGWAAITAPAQGYGITVNAGSGNVALIGLEIDGAQAADAGIVFNSGSSLAVANCTLQNFVNDGQNPTSGAGIFIQPSGTLDLTITNTTASNNALSGIYYRPLSGSPNSNGVIKDVIANNNEYGVDVYTGDISGGTAVFAISNTVVSDNSVAGIIV